MVEQRIIRQSIDLFATELEYNFILIIIKGNMFL